VCLPCVAAQLNLGKIHIQYLHVLKLSVVAIISTLICFEAVFDCFDKPRWYKLSLTPSHCPSLGFPFHRHHLAGHIYNALLRHFALSNSQQ
jgi:hypothetical protein